MESHNMLWIPPGLDHEAITLEGQAHREENSVVCVHWMTWCLPWNLCRKASRDLFGGKTSHSAAPPRNDVLAVVMIHCCEARRKAGNNFFFGFGGSEYEE